MAIAAGTIGLGAGRAILVAELASVAVEKIRGERGHRAGLRVQRSSPLPINQRRRLRRRPRRVKRGPFWIRVAAPVAALLRQHRDGL